ncbi:MAG: OmpA family protein [Gemmatimonadota bacterium]
MIKRFLGLAACAAIGLAPVVSAQQAGSLEVGAFGRYNWFDSKSPLDNAFGGGGRLGIFFDPKWELEIQGSYAKTNSPGAPDIKYVPLTGRLQLNESILIFGVGYTYHIFSGDFQKNLGGAQGLVGLRFGKGHPINLRIDGTLDYIFHGWNDAAHPGVTQGNWNPGVQVGLSIVTGTVSDHDKDGIKDKFDQCPNTPPGEPADEHGCSASQRDGDGDHIMDNVDRCPNSPAGSVVDAAGCPPDADGDKVPDSIDKCPNSPPGSVVDATGCPPDADGDKVTDALDKCPNTPVGTVVDANGCPKDADNDKILDVNDKCPATPAGEQVDPSGCSASQRDTDGDGVKDNLDKCPNSAPGARVDASGCAPVLFQPGKKALILEGVTFETGKATLTATSTGALDRVAQALQENPAVTVEIGGHTDITGSRATNTRLSKARAETVKSYLASKGVTATRMTTKGYGPDQPVGDNKTVDGRTMNRRVELKKTSN